MLQEILDACAATSGRRLSISARADRYGITIERSDQRAALTPELLADVHDDLLRLGAFLREDSGNDATFASDTSAHG